MTFGFKNAAQTFQRCIDSICRGLSFAFPYLDDILIASKGFEQHLNHLEVLFSRLQDAGFVINVSKCIFATPEIVFLGHVIDSAGIRPSKEKVDAIINFPKPITVKDLRRFMGMVNFYRSFIPNAVEFQRILNNYFIGSKRKNDKTKIIWSEEASQAFEKTKISVNEATQLCHPRENVEISLMVDASDTAIGAVVQQFVNNVWQPLGFFSSKLNDAQRKYSAYDRELLAAYSAVKHFRYLLEGRVFVIYTDHKPIAYAFQQN